MAGSLHLPAHSRWAMMFAGALLVPGFFHAACAETGRDGYGDLPPPPQHIDPAAEQRLELELFVNGMRSGIVAPAVKQGSRFRLRTADMRRAGILLQTTGETLFLDSLEGLRADYDAPRQQLHLTVSPEYLPAQRVGRDKRRFERAQYDIGALLNYDAYVSGGDRTPVQASLWHEARIFGPAGIVSTTGALRSGSAKNYVRFDTYWRWSDERSMTTIEAGDIITRSLPWAPAVRLGGLQISRDFSVRPDVVTYPLPEFAGSAALPSTVDLVVHGQRVAGADVNPGPFALDTLPPINGYGEANLIVTDMHGRSVSTTMPFYISSALLRPGLTDYAAALGAFRRNYGMKNFDYGGLAASASARHGVTDGLTLEVRAEVADDMQLAGGGAVVKLGNFGTVSASYSRSFRDGSDGGELTLGYDYQTRGFSIGLRHRRRDGDYTDLGLLDREGLGGWERLTAVTASLSLGPAGTLGIGYFDFRQALVRDARLANIAWALPLWGESRLHASLSREFVERSWSGALTLSVPLGGGILGAGVVQGQNGRTGLRADYSRAAPVEGGFGWNANAVSEDGASPYWRGDMTWRLQPVQLRAGAYGRDKVTGWLGISGSLVFMDDAVFAANRVSDAFAVVSTNGEPGIPVRYENQLIGTTNANGQLLVPSASAYYPGRYDIDTLSLPANVKAPVVSQRVAVAAGSGHIIKFPVEHVTAARATIRTVTGEPLPAGAAATINGTLSTYVGWDGILFVERVAADNRVEIELADGGTCHVTFAADPKADDIIELGELTCRR
ncbi:Type I pili (Chaperone-usher pili assembly system) [Sphingopyxis sp. LC81]|uniref:fimbria/pilus outer membrane usher protein n=1 Tax=Sphingopyxis sp. LC81 TaxID=1502850 RepID=UPI00050DE6F9|nr:fimbria/pilus outer membrane usher protein [Sphingopyxis sp. LC81]KGB56307.1 Type I pili (Chaperone-usher pili assembly system) [Sphingopyxis sp. LC81]